MGLHDHHHHHHGPGQQQQLVHQQQQQQEWQQLLQLVRSTCRLFIKCFSLVILLKMWLKPFYGLNFQSLLQMMLNLYQTFCHFRYFTLKGFRFESLLLLLPAFYIPTFFAALVCVRVVGMPVKLMGSKVFDLRPPRSCKDEQLKLEKQHQQLQQQHVEQFTSKDNIPFLALLKLDNFMDLSLS